MLQMLLHIADIVVSKAAPDFTNNLQTHSGSGKDFIMLALLAVHNSGGIKKFQNYFISVSVVKNDIDWL